MYNTDQCENVKVENVKVENAKVENVLLHFQLLHFQLLHFHIDQYYTLFIYIDRGGLPRTQALCVVLWLAWPSRGPRGSFSVFLPRVPSHVRLMT